MTLRQLLIDLISKGVGLDDEIEMRPMEKHERIFFEWASSDEGKAAIAKVIKEETAGKDSGEQEVTDRPQPDLAATIAELRQAVQDALLRVADNVAKHIIQRDGWEPGDKCFRIDLRQSEEEIMQVCLDALEAAQGENARLRAELIESERRHLMTAIELDHERT